MELDREAEDGEEVSSDGVTGAGGYWKKLGEKYRAQFLELQ